MKLSIQNFSGMIPLQHPGKLPEHAAQTAENCCTESGIVQFRNTVSDWVDPESGNVSSVNQRKYAILNGILTEDGVSLHMEKPSKPSVRKIPFWTLEDGYTFKKAGVSYPKFQLSSAIGIAGTPSILDPVSVVYDGGCIQRCGIHIFIAELNHISSACNSFAGNFHVCFSA